jgi:3-oxoacyl-[acyl-carrier protein] reductase
MQTIYNDLKNKVVLITGASRGIGKDIAKALAYQNAHVVFNWRGEKSAAQDLIDELKELGASDCHALFFDMTDFTTMKEEIDKFTKEVAPISGLINNAGISKDSLMMRTKPEDIAQILDVNLKGTMVLTNFLSRNFLKAKEVSIINMSSIVGLMGNLSQTTYAASKAGLIGYTKSVAKELASRKVRCNAICPGFIQTQMTDELSDKAKESYLGSIPMGEFGQTEDVANLVMFLLSTNSKYITGEVIKVDGGLYI